MKLVSLYSTIKMMQGPINIKDFKYLTLKAKPTSSFGTLKTFTTQHAVTSNEDPKSAAQPL